MAIRLPKRKIGMLAGPSASSADNEIFTCPTSADSSTYQTPKLSEHVPQGINPKILMLDLTITASGKGDMLMSWREVSFFKSIERDQYSNVDILWDGKRIESLEVQDVE